MAYKSRKERRRAAGGTLYNAKGSNEASEVDAKSDGFKRGGAKKRADGGSVDGAASTPRLDKRARGGALKHRNGMARGGSPFSAAKAQTNPAGKSESSGPGEQAPTG